MNKTMVLGLLIGFGATQTFPALASTSSVSSGDVKKGSSVEARVSYAIDDDSERSDDRIRLRQQFVHGFTDTFGIRLITTQDKRKGEGITANQYRIEAKQQFFEAEDDGFNGELHLLYRKGDTNADVLEARLNGSTKIADDLSYLQNLLFSHEVGEDSDSGLGFEARFALEKSFDDGYRIGVDMLNDFGNLTQQSGFEDQGHTIGPYFKNSYGNFYYSVGYRYGFFEGADDQAIRLFTGYKF